MENSWRLRPSTIHHAWIFEPSRSWPTPAAIALLARGKAVQFSKSGKLVAASIADGTILVWDSDRIEMKKP